MTETPGVRLVRPSSRGRITIPVEFRKHLGISEDSDLQVTLSDGAVHIRPVQPIQADRGSAWVRELYDYFAPVREEAEARGYTEEEINGWIDEALAEVRRER